MFHSIIYFVFFRYLKTKRKKNFFSLTSFLSIIGISLGMISLIIVISVMNGFENFIENEVLFYTPHSIITTKEKHFNTKEYPKSILKNLQGVKYISKIIQSEIFLENKNNITIANMISLNKNSHEPLTKYLTKKEHKLIINKKNYLILDINLANELKIKKNDTVTLIIPNINQSTSKKKILNQKKFIVAGFLTRPLELYENKVLINQKEAKELMNYKDNEISGWRLYYSKPLNIYQFKKNLPKNMIWIDWRKEKGELFRSIKMEKNITYILFSLIVIVASFNIIISISFSVIEKYSDIAILKTLGFNYLKLILIFILHGIKDIIIGVFFGISLGVFLTKKINFILSYIGILDEYMQLPTLINYYDIFLISLIPIIIFLIGIFYPLHSISKIQVAKILSYEQ